MSDSDTPNKEPSTTAEDLAEEYWLSEAAESSDCNTGGHFTAKEIRKAYLAGYRARDAEVERLETARKVHVAELHNADAELTQLRQSLAESERKAAGLYLDRLVERRVSLNDAKRNPEILDAMIESADRDIREHYKKSREALASPSAAGRGGAWGGGEVKITQERLLNIAQALVASGERTGMPDIQMTGPELVSLLKLARLGLWAEEHGIWIVKHCTTGNDQGRPGLSKVLDEIGEVYGYGAAMSQLSFLWKKLLEKDGITGGQHTCGPCESTIKAALAALPPDPRTSDAEEK